MGSLRSFLLLPALFCAAPLQAARAASWQSHVDEASARFGIPSAWIARVMQIESAGRTHVNGKPIRSSAGAMGLMQLMPGTWAQLQARLRLGTDPDNPRDNILAGTYYLRLMYDRFGYPGLFAAYNAGPNRYQEHVAGRRDLPAETRRYLAQAVDSARPVLAVQVRQAQTPSFVIRRADPKATAAAVQVAYRRHGGLFACCKARALSASRESPDFHAPDQGQDSVLFAHVAAKRAE